MERAAHPCAQLPQALGTGTASAVCCLALGRLGQLGMDSGLVSVHLRSEPWEADGVEGEGQGGRKPRQGDSGLSPCGAAQNQV